MDLKRVMFLLVFASVILPCNAQFDGKITKNSFYDTEKTIMMEVAPYKVPKTAKYWEKNPFYSSKYRPLFMLSNKELYDLMPRENTSVVNIINAPSVYNISLKSQSIKHISYTQPAKQADAVKKIAQEIKPTKKLNPSISSIQVYEQAKNPEVDSDRKIEAAIALKGYKKSSDTNLAIDLLDDVIKKEPYNAYAFYLKGELYFEKKCFEDSMKNYVEALKINPYSKQSYLGIAKILEPTNKELAMKYYAKAR